MGGVCALVAGGEYSPLSGIGSADLVIACDKGLEYCRREGVLPQLLVGDFDSFTGELPSDIPRLKLPCEKDDTDTLAALRHALDRGYDTILIYCALGGRLDHMMANIQSAAFAAGLGAYVCIIDENNPMFFFKDSERVFPRKEGYYLSVFSLTEKAEGVCLTGAKYNVCDGLLENTFPIGVSNEWASEKVTVSVRKGTLMVMHSRR